MKPYDGEPTESCRCCEVCKNCTKEFQKVADLKGLIIYHRHISDSVDALSGCIGLIQNESNATDKNVFIIHNTNDVELTTADCLPELEDLNINCERCRKIMEHAQQLILTIPAIDKNAIRAICDHCRSKQESCIECQDAVKNYFASDTIGDSTKERIKAWLSKVKVLLKDAFVHNIESHKENSRARSELNIDQIFRKSANNFQKTISKGLSSLLYPTDGLSKSVSIFPRTIGKEIDGAERDSKRACQMGRSMALQSDDAKSLFYSDNLAEHISGKSKKQKHVVIRDAPPVPIHSPEDYAISKGYSFMDDNRLREISIYGGSVRGKMDKHVFKTRPRSADDYDAPIGYFDDNVVPPDRFRLREEIYLKKESSYEQIGKEGTIVKPGKELDLDRHKQTDKDHGINIFEADVALTEQDRNREGKYLRKELSYSQLDKTELGRQKQTHRDYEAALLDEDVVPPDQYRHHEEKTSRRETSYDKIFKETEMAKPLKKQDFDRHRQTDRQYSMFDDEYDQEKEAQKRGDQFKKDMKKEPKYYKKRASLDDFEVLRRHDQRSEELLKEMISRAPDSIPLKKSYSGDLPSMAAAAVAAAAKKKDYEELQDFSFTFPHEAVIQKKAKRQKDSSELIKETEAMLLARAEDERKRQIEEERLRKAEQEEKKRLALEEKERRARERKKIADEKKKKEEERKQADEQNLREKLEHKQKEEHELLHKKQKKEEEILYSSSVSKSKIKEPKIKPEAKVKTRQTKEKADLNKSETKSIYASKEKTKPEPKVKSKIEEPEEKSKSDIKEKPKIKEPKEKSKPEPKEISKIEEPIDRKEPKEIQKDSDEKSKKLELVKSDNLDKEGLKSERESAKKEREMEKKGKGEELRQAKEDKSKEKDGKGGVKKKNEDLLKIERDLKQKEKEEREAFKKQQIEQAKLDKEQKLREKELEQKLKDLGKPLDKKGEEKSIKETSKSKADLSEPKIPLKQEDPKTKELNISSVKVRKNSPDDLILQLVRLKQSQHQNRFLKEKPVSLIMTPKQIAGHKKNHRHKIRETCAMCISSDLELQYDSDLKKDEVDVLDDIIIGQKVFKYKPPLTQKSEEDEGVIVPLLFQTKYTDFPLTEKEPVMEKEEKLAPMVPGKNPKATPATDHETSKGVIRYALSDRTFIDKGWTMLPTEKVVRKMNVYRMRPAHPEFDWFQHNKNKRLMQYDTGERLAVFDDNGRGRWYYRNGRLALDYYDAEELNAQQRFVIYSSGEPDDRGRSQPYTILASFDYLGNGIVFDHSGKIRLKYNQTEGVVLDRNIGPVSHWKWHTLNDPPVLQQVMIDTQLAHKDPDILKMGGPGDNKTRPDNEEMLAIEFDNFIKEKSKKLTQSFKPFQIKMKALKINDYFSLKVLDQATVYLIFRDGTTNLKLNMGMILDHKEIVDTDTAELGEVSNNLERLPARTDSLAELQNSVAYAQRFERSRTERERRLRPQVPSASVDKLTAAASRPLCFPLRTVPTGSTTGSTRNCYCKCTRKPKPNNVYYNNQFV